jgi:hypothetical protein
LYDASKERTRQRRATIQGNTYQPRDREIITVEMKEIPDLRSGSAIVPIPAFAFSKAWRKANQELISANTHRIDTKLTKGPDISAFLDNYRRQVTYDQPCHAPVPTPNDRDLMVDNTMGNDVDDEVAGDMYQVEEGEMEEQETGWVDAAGDEVPGDGLGDGPGDGLGRIEGEVTVTGTDKRMY